MPQDAGLSFDAGAELLQLVVFGADAVSAHVLPRSGSVSIGRDEASDVRIDDSSVSRRHAVLEIGENVMLRDCGSANGSWLRDSHVGPATAPMRDTRLEPGKSAKIGVGDAFNIGSVLVMLRRSDVVDVKPEMDRGIVLRDPAMHRLYDMARRVAATPISVLLLGETGTGKEVLAETIHRNSSRSTGPFVRLNCAALAESLLESELFGHERGAFTGAVKDKPGLFEMAERGTVFLDEVGEIPAAVQVKLLRAIEERKVTRVGAVTPRSIDVRFIAATHRDLEARIADGSFREDLFFRLNGISLEIPPLRERVGEIRELATLFASRASKQMNRSVAPAVSAAALAALEAHRWPGNIRELRNVIERAVVLCGNHEILPEHLRLDRSRASVARPHASSDPQIAATAPVSEPVPDPASAGLKADVEALERRRIVDALDQCAGNQTQAAELLGISRRSLVNRLEAYNIPRPRKKT